MIIALGRVRDGQVLPVEFISSHEHVIVPIFSAGDAERHVEAWKTKLGNKSLVCCAPAIVGAPAVEAWFREMSTMQLSPYVDSLPPRYNPFLTGTKTAGGILIPGEVGMRVSKKPS